MSDFGATYDEMDSTATKLDDGKDSIDELLGQLQGHVDELVQDGFKTEKASDKFAGHHRGVRGGLEPQRRPPHRDRTARLSSSPGEFFSEMRNLAPDGSMVRSVSQFLSGQTDEMWELVGGAASTGEQAMYALGAVGTHYNNLYLLGYSGYSAVAGGWELVSE